MVPKIDVIDKMAVLITSMTRSPNRSIHTSSPKFVTDQEASAALTNQTAVPDVTSPGPLGTSLFFAVLAGGIVLNVIKEELPIEQEGRFWMFAAGAGVSTIFLLVI